MDKNNMKKKKGKSVLYFILGVLLSTCISTLSIVAVLPQITIVMEENKDTLEENEKNLEMVTSELVRDTVNSSISDYFEENNITQSLTEEDIAAITQYITDGVREQVSVTDGILVEIKNLIKVSVENAVSKIDENTDRINENITNSQTILKNEMTDTKDSLSEKIKTGNEETEKNARNYTDERLEAEVSNLEGEITDTKDCLEEEITDTKDSLLEKIKAGNEETEKNAKDYTDERLEEEVSNLKEDITDTRSTLLKYMENGDIEIAENLKNYIDCDVVPAVVASIEMNSEDIAAINEKIALLGNDYEIYKENTNVILDSIKSVFNSFQEETEDNFAEVAGELGSLCESYHTYVSTTDNSIREIEGALDERITISEFEEFKEDYENYKSDMGDTINSISGVLNGLEENKADKTTVTVLANDFNSLQEAYTAFVGEDGRFSELTSRVTTTESAVVKNGDDIAALKEKISKLENSLYAAENEITALNSSLGNTDSRITELNSNLESVWKDIYPVGAIYISASSENPATLFGGKWERIQDRFLMCAGSTYTAGTTGGNSTVTLGAGNIPTLNITGSTAAKNSVSTSANGAYSGTITSNGTYAGGTYGTDGYGNHTHNIPNIPSHFYHGNFNIEDGLTGGYIVGGYSDSGYTTFESGSHSHTVTIPSQTITSSGSLSIGNHSHTINIPALSVTGKYTNNSVQSVNVLNPYISVYVWKRIS